MSVAKALVIGLFIVAARANAQPGMDLGLTAHYQELGRLGPENKPWTFKVSDPTADLTMIQVLTTANGLAWKVIGSNGIKYGPTELDLAGGFSQTIPYDQGGQTAPSPFQPPEGGVAYVIGVPFKMVAVEFSSPAPLIAEVPLLFNADFLGSTYQMGLVPNDSVVLLGRPAVMTIPVFRKDIPMAGADVQILAVAPSGQSYVGDGHDDGRPPDADAGDGLYTAVFKANEVGAWNIGAVTTMIAEDGSKVVRTFSADIDVVDPRAHFSSSLATPTCVFQQGTGLLQGVRITASVEVGMAGTFRLGADLRVPSGQVVHYTEDRTLAQGPQAVALIVPASALITDSPAGPATLVRLSLSVTEPMLVEVDHIEPANAQTCSFSAIDIPGPDLEFLEPCTSRLIDTNGNGLAEHLVVDLPLRVRAGGFFEFTAALCNRCGVRMAEVHGTVVLQRSPRFVLELVFDGPSIGRWGVDGPYYVCDLTLWRPGGGGVFMQWSSRCETEAYSALQFEQGMHCGDRNGNGVCDLCEIQNGGVGVDQNGDGIPDDSPNTQPCIRVADITGPAGPPSGPDGCVSNADLVAFLQAFQDGALLADVSGPGGRPDGVVDQYDWDAFMLAYADCPHNCPVINP